MRAEQLLPRFLGARAELTSFPAAVDLTHKAGRRCLYEWPHCAQPMYATAQPVTVNLTLLFGLLAAVQCASSASDVGV